MRPKKSKFELKKTRKETPVKPKKKKKEREVKRLCLQRVYPIICILGEDEGEEGEEGKGEEASKGEEGEGSDKTEKTYERLHALVE